MRWCAACTQRLYDVTHPAGAEKSLPDDELERQAADRLAREPKGWQERVARIRAEMTGGDS